MRVYVDIHEHLWACLRDLAAESYRPPRHHAAFLLSEGIERAIKERTRVRESDLEAYLAEDPDHAPTP